MTSPAIANAVPSSRARLGLIAIVVLGLIAVFFHQHIWNYYVAPRDAIAVALNRCRADADKVFALQIAKWIDDHHTNQSNPFRKQRDDMAETCMKGNGWCSLGDDSIWPSTDFAPRDPIARLIYMHRYWDGARLPCYD